MTRADLSPGLQAAQAAHAAFQFAVEHPEETRSWYSGSNYLILVSVPDEDSLLEWADLVYREGVPYSLVTEPDLPNGVNDVGQHTSLAVNPSHLGDRFSSLPLLGKEVVAV